MDSILRYALSDSMTELKIRNCNYQQLPDIARFNKLNVLDASNNLLGKIRRQDLQSDSLQTVIFTRNRIRRIPFPKDSKITTVILESNNLKRFPRSLKRLKHLETLNVSHNKIFSIPDLSVLPKLKDVDLGYNNLEYLPWNLIKRTDIHILILRDNPFIMTESDKETLQKLSEKREKQGASLIY